jgi:hypothetical protein
MNRPPTRQRSSALLVLALGSLLVALVCGGCRPASVSGGSVAAGVIVTRTASASSSAGADHHLTVSASCRSDEQMLAGGYAAVAVFESDYTLLSTYPSAIDTWTVSTDSGSSYQLEAFVYCLSSYPSLGIQIHQSGDCPTGAVRLSTGLQGVNPFTGTAGTPYVLCASRDVTPTSQGFRVGSTELDCASQATGNSLSESRTFSYTCTARASRSLSGSD